MQDSFLKSFLTVAHIFIHFICQDICNFNLLIIITQKSCIDYIQQNSQIIKQMGNLCTGAQNSQTRESLAESSAKNGTPSASKKQLRQKDLSTTRDHLNMSTNMRLSTQHSTRQQQQSVRSQNMDHLRVFTRYTYGNGDHYEGQVLLERRDIRDGQGIFYCSNKQKRSNYEYHGEWRHNVREGHGHCYYYNDELYVGQWKADKRSGQGELFSRKEDRYKGSWKNDMREGKGTLTAQSGAVYTGKWAQDKKHGPGQMTGTDKRVFSEVWKYGVLISRKLNDERVPSFVNKDFLEIKVADCEKKIKIDVNDCDSVQAPNQQDYQRSEEIKVAQMLADKPLIDKWTRADVQEWIQKCTLLAGIDDLSSIFEANQVDGQALLGLNEEALKGDGYEIESLGRRKKIIRAINFLKASKCRQVRNNGSCNMMLLDEQNLSQSSVMQQQLQNRSGMSVPAIDRKAILRSAHTFFQEKAQARNTTNLQSVDLEMSRENEYQPFRRLSTMNSGRLSVQLKHKNYFWADNSQTQQNFEHEAARQSLVQEIKDGVEMQAHGVLDPESSMALGQNAGLIEALTQNGFNFFIEFKELLIDPRTDLIGRGGYGDVFKARWNGTKVAVKKFGRRYIARKALKDFIKEIEMLNQLRHPNIVLYMGVSVDEQTQSHFYMITEFVSKGSLFDLLHGRKLVLDDAQIIKIAKQMAIALLYLHNRQLFHCDLKSQNVLIAEDWSVKLCDFGLSRYQSKFDADNQGKIGTPHWMAPEILRGEKYTSAADVYSFGAILWEMLVSDIPFKDRKIPQITGMVGYYRETLKVPPQCNASLRQIVNNCLLFEPERRPGFEDIVSYLKQVEIEKVKNDCAAPPQMINKLRDFLY